MVSKYRKEKDVLEAGDGGFIRLRHEPTATRARWVGTQQAKGSREAGDMAHSELGDSSRLAGVENG